MADFVRAALRGPAKMQHHPLGKIKGRLHTRSRAVSRRFLITRILSRRQQEASARLRASRLTEGTASGPRRCFERLRAEPVATEPAPGGLVKPRERRAVWDRHALPISARLFIDLHEQ
jgi:hypothetical protein